MTRKQVEGQIFENLPFDVFALLLPTPQNDHKYIYLKNLKFCYEINILFENE